MLGHRINPFQFPVNAAVKCIKVKNSMHLLGTFTGISSLSFVGSTWYIFKKIKSESNNCLLNIF